MSGPQHMTASQLSQQYQSVLKPANKPENEISQVTSTDDKYEVKLSIHEFEPHELSVKVVDRYVHIEGRHEEKNDKVGFFTRKFTRSYFLPEGAQPEFVRCTFNIDTNLLTVTAPIVVKKPSKEYIIPVIIVGTQPAPSGSVPTSAPDKPVPKTPKKKVPKQASTEEKSKKKECSPPKDPQTPRHHHRDTSQDQNAHHPHHHNHTFQHHHSRSEHHLHQQHQTSRSQPPECQHEQHPQRSSSSSTSAPTTATRRQKQQYPDHQEIDRLLYQQLLEQQQRQRLHQQQQQQIFNHHQQQYQQQFQTNK